MIPTVETVWDVVKRHDLQLVLFDMDDTLYPEYDYVLSGFSVVGRYMQERYGISQAFEQLKELFDRDSARVFNRLMDAHGISYTDEDVRTWISLYKNHRPTLTLDASVADMLSALKENGIRLGVITDGNPVQQQYKFEALGLSRWIEECVITDRLGGEQYRKPHPEAFERMARYFDVPFEKTAYIGDNPKKDFAIRAVYPIVTVHYQGERHGLYRQEAYRDDIKPCYILSELK